MGSVFGWALFQSITKEDGEEFECTQIIKKILITI
jgi:hypothetical protein